MAACREVIALQFGHYANFVGAHWWNIQESSFCYDPKADFKREINHDVLFREGTTLQGEQTYTPRLLVFDLKGSLRNLPKLGSLYNPTQQHDDVKWSGELSLHRGSPEPKNEFQMDIENQGFASSSDLEINYADTQESAGRSHDIQPKEGKEATVESETQDDTSGFTEKSYNLEEDVVVWSDFLGIQFHPKTVHFAGNYLHEATMSPFDVFGHGQGLMQDGSFLDELEDSLHFFAEECDSLQGFQVKIWVFYCSCTINEKY